MIGALFVVMFQAVAGPPVQPPAPTTAPPVVAETPPATETAQEARLRELRERQKLVCRNEAVLGSRLPVRRCTSAADDANAGSDSRAWIDRVQSQMPTKG